MIEQDKMEKVQDSCDWLKNLLDNNDDFINKYLAGFEADLIGNDLSNLIDRMSLMGRFLYDDIIVECLTKIYNKKNEIISDSRTLKEIIFDKLTKK